MLFFGMPWPMHHTQPLNMADERVIEPTIEEMKDGVEAVGVTEGWCLDADCRRRFLFNRYRYVGGWGPIHRMRDSKAIAAMRARLKQARESDWVWATHHEYGTLIKVTVR